MEFDLEGFLKRNPPSGACTNLDSVFSDAGRKGTLLEMPCNLPETVIADLKRTLDQVEFNRYPTGGIADLHGRIAAWLSLPASHATLFGNGAFEIIDLVMQSLAAKARVLTLDPDFFMYRLAARKYAVDLETCTLSADLAIDPAEMRRRVAAFRPDLIVLSNPHNPTSTWFRSETIQAVSEMAPGLVLIDEVYAPFAPQPDASIALMRRYPNLMVLRSFSKVGAAAIRFGFLAGHKKILERIGSWQTTFAVNSLSAMVAGSIIKNYDEVAENIRALIDARESMVRQLGDCQGTKVYPSGTNFIVVRLCGHDARKVHERLVATGVKVVLYEGAAGLENCLRFSVDTPDNNRLAVAAFAAAVSG